MFSPVAFVILLAIRISSQGSMEGDLAHMKVLDVLRTVNLGLWLAQVLRLSALTGVTAPSLGNSSKKLHPDLHTLEDLQWWLSCDNQLN